MKGKHSIRFLAYKPILHDLQYMIWHDDYGSFASTSLEDSSQAVYDFISNVTN